MASSSPPLPAVLYGRNEVPNLQPALELFLTTLRVRVCRSAGVPPLSPSRLFAAALRPTQGFIHQIDRGFQITSFQGMPRCPDRRRRHHDNHSARPSYPLPPSGHPVAAVVTDPHTVPVPPTSLPPSGPWYSGHCVRSSRPPRATLTPAPVPAPVPAPIPAPVPAPVGCRVCV